MSVFPRVQGVKLRHRRRNGTRAQSLAYLDSAGFSIGIPRATMNFPISIET
jgi:hypothetical protein